MDINVFRTLMTVVMFAVFLAIIAWAFSGRRKERFDRAARSVLEEADDIGGAPMGRAGNGRG